MVEHSSKTDSIFWSALGIAGQDERDRYLEDACAGASGLRAQIDELLAAYPKVQQFLEQPAIPVDATVLHESSNAEGPGTVIGPYKLLEQIGEGGFGVVFLAEQERPVRRRVALKIIKPGMDTRQVIARFEAERQALAMMDHPNIAKVLDAGTVGQALPDTSANSHIRQAQPDLPPTPDTRHLTPNVGRPYFVMELVQGIPITEYCDQCNLTTRERLELFITVCHAVQHAHQKGVIHRDIKPTNILVAMQDGRPAPKIIDFGVAKALNQRLTEHTLATGYAQMIGTPLYMSPEQAELSPLGADTRSDIYSLGVLLYELLTGTTPFDKDRLHSASYDELRRILREEDPPRPSARLSSLSLRERAGVRETAKLATTVAEQRRTDLRRLRQMVRGDLDWVVMKCLEKDRNRRYETASGLAQDIARFLRDEPVEARPPSAAYRLRRFAYRNRAAIATTVGIAILLLTAAVLSGWQAFRASRSERQARASERQAVVNAQRAKELTGILVGALQKLGPPAHEQGQSEEGELEFRNAERLLRESLQLDLTDAVMHYWLSIVLLHQNRIDEAEAALHVSLVLEPTNIQALVQLIYVLQLQGKWPEVEAAHRQVRRLIPNDASAHFRFATFLQSRGELDEAIAEYRQAIHLRSELASAHWNLGLILEREGRFGEAIAEFKETVRLQPNNALAHSFLAWNLVNCPDPVLRDPALSLEHAKKALELRPDASNSQGIVGVAYLRLGHCRKAIEALEKANKMREGADDDWLRRATTFAHLFLAMAHWQLGERQEARESYRKAVEWIEKKQADDEELRRIRKEADDLMETSASDERTHVE